MKARPFQNMITKINLLAIGQMKALHCSRELLRYQHKMLAGETIMSQMQVMTATYQDWMRSI